MSAPEDIPSTGQVGLSIPADIRQLGERLVTPGRHRRTETRTSVGESEALIAAAGEYVRRMDRARQGLEEMRALGVQIDEAAVRRSAMSDSKPSPPSCLPSMSCFVSVSV